MRSVARGGLGLVGAVLAGLLAGSAANPDPADTVGIGSAALRQPAPAPGPDAATGTYTADCGRNTNGHSNSDNVITKPGEHDGAHHRHEYVGNLGTDAFATDDTLAAAGTTCANGDRSSYYWPAMTIVGPDGRRALPPASVRVRFAGSPVGKVVGMPRFLRNSVGNAHAVTAADPRRLPVWTCSGAPDRATPRYPRCPTGEQVVREFDFPDCWDGRNTDSPNHRAHVLPSTAGVCPHGMFAIPALRLLVAYDVPAGARFEIDGFPEEGNSPLTDHADFISVMTDELMTTIVSCLNRGAAC